MSQIDCKVNYKWLKDGSIIIYYRRGFPETKHRRLGKLLMPDSFDCFRQTVILNFLTVVLAKLFSFQGMDKINLRPELYILDFKNFQFFSIE